MAYPSAAALYLSHFVSPISVLKSSEKNSSSVNPNVRTGFPTTLERTSAISRGVTMVEQAWMMLSVEDEIVRMQLRMQLKDALLTHP